MLGFLLLERCCHVDHFAASLDGFDHFWSILFIEGFNTVIACDNKVLMAERDGTSFGFSRTLVMVTPDFEIVT